MRAVRSLVSIVLALVLIGTATAAVVMVASSGVLWADALPSQSPDVAAPTAEAAQGDAPVDLVNSLQVSQPRDPFRPLITEDSPVAGLPGVGGTPGETDGGFTPVGITITLREVEEIAPGEYEATIVVNGTSWVVQEGDTFATSYKVVSIDEDSAVIMFGDNVFELSVGEQILK